MIVAWIILCAATSFSVTSASVTEEPDKSGFLWKWAGFIVSRSGIYLILVTAISINTIITLIRKKLENFEINRAAERQLQKNGYPSLVQKFQNPVGIENTITISEDTESIKNRLREAEATVAALKIELEETLKTKASIENSIEELDRDRSFSEDELVKVKISSSAELEKLNKENSTLKSQLERTKSEIEELSRVVEVLQREARITEAALRDQQSLTQHLEITRNELERLKTELRGTKIERDTAVRLASEQIYKMTSDRSTHRRELIEEMIDGELKKMREEEEAATERGAEITDRTRPASTSCNSATERDVRQRTFATTRPMAVDASPEVSIRNNDESIFVTNFLPQVHKNALGDGPLPVNFAGDDTYNLATENSMIYSNQEGANASSEDDDIEQSDEMETESEDAQTRIVSGSPAFRAFLQSTFGR